MVKLGRLLGGLLVLTGALVGALAYLLASHSDTALGIAASLLPFALGVLLLWSCQVRVGSATLAVGYGVFFATKPLVKPVLIDFDSPRTFALLEGPHAGFVVGGLLLLVFGVVLLRQHISTTRAGRKLA